MTLEEVKQKWQEVYNRWKLPAYYNISNEESLKYKKELVKDLQSAECYYAVCYPYCINIKTLSFRTLIQLLYGNDVL